MSEVLLRRQKFIKQIRRKQVQSYMQTIRLRLLSQAKQMHWQRNLQENKIFAMKEELVKSNYSRRDVQYFLRSLEQYNSPSLCSVKFLELFEQALMHHFQFGKNAELNEMHNLAKEILVRIIQCPVKESERHPLEYCFQQILNILSTQNFQMGDVWKAMALLRSQIFFQRSFIEFESYIKLYPLELIHFLNITLEVFINFTSIIEDSHIRLSLSNIFDILKSLQQIMNSYILGDEDLVSMTKILQNILALNESQALRLICDEKIIDHLLMYLDTQNTKVNNSEANPNEGKELKYEADANSKASIIAFLAQCLSFPQKDSSRVLAQHKNLVQIIAIMLPAFSNFQFITPTIRQYQWPTFNKKITLQVLLFLCNAAACSISLPFIHQYQIFKWFITFSEYPDPHIKGQIAIFFYNTITYCRDEQIEILLEKDLLLALNNLIRQEFNIDGLLYGLKTLKHILKASRNFPKNNLAWNFNPGKILSYCQRLGLVAYVEGLVVAKRGDVSQESVTCLQLFGAY